MNAEHSARLRDFDGRANAGEEVAEFLGTQYIAVHPFADDMAILQKLSWPAEQCLEVDAYWLVSGDVVFVQVISSTQGEARQVGRYARWNPMNHYVNLVAVVTATVITRPVFENELKVFLEQGILAMALTQGSKLGARLLAV